SSPPYTVLTQFQFHLTIGLRVTATSCPFTMSLRTIPRLSSGRCFWACSSCGPRRRRRDQDDSKERVCVKKEVTAHRLAAYSDAVFAVIVTVMVLGLRAPDEPAFSALWPLWPTAISYAMSYLFIAIMDKPPLPDAVRRSSDVETD